MDVDQIRTRFPALRNGYIFADNAGGSQILSDVIEKVTDYYTNTNVQLGADYSVGQAATRRVMDDAPAITAKFINAASPDEIAFTSSTTMGVENLVRALENDFAHGDEIIVTEEHEANVGPWVKMAKRKGVEVKFWTSRVVSDSGNPFAISPSTEDLIALITPRTRLIAISACSNILGELIDVPAVIQAIREEAKKQGTRRTEVCVDCVAYAPHRRIDVQAFDCDYAVFSYYKVYGPHVSVVYTRSNTHEVISSLAHYFIDPTPIGHYPPAIKIQPGGPGYELTYASTGVLPYFSSISPIKSESNDMNATLNASFDLIKAHEQSLLTPLIKYLLSEKVREKGVRIVGLETDDAKRRAPTISFVVVGADGKKRAQSRDVVKTFDEAGGIGIRYGHFYAHRLLTRLGIDNEGDGIVRISLVHYNTVEEVERIVELLEKALA